MINDWEFDKNSSSLTLVEKLLIKYVMDVRDCLNYWRKELIIEKPAKNGLQMVTRKKRFTFKWRFKYLFALNNRSEQILTFSVKPKLHTSYILIFFSTIL